MTTIKKIRRVDGLENGWLFELSEEVAYSWWDFYTDEDRYETTKYVIISGISNLWGTETFIFPANAEGEIVDWKQLDGSLYGMNSIDEVIRRNGWELVND